MAGNCIDIINVNSNYHYSVTSTMLIKWCMFIFIFFGGINQPIAQNLVPNGGFEAHEQIECLYCALESDKFKKLTQNWDDLNTNPILCSCQYTPTKDEEKYKRCEIQAYKGCSMIEMKYTSRCTDFKHETQGCASYLGTELDSALQVGKVYELSFWIYIEAGEDYDPGYPAHIGISLFPKAVRNPDGKMLHDSGMLLDTVIYNEWYKVSWKVRPVCRLGYLAIGVHRAQDWPSRHDYESYSSYYIDEVSVRAFDSKEANNAHAVKNYCKPSPLNESVLTEEVEGVICYFETGKSLLSDQDKVKLDSFALRAKSKPYAVFTLSGHTDSIGRNHKQLSRERMNSVLDYLETKHKIPPFRFFQIAAGDEQEAASNKNASGRQKNRRVEIQQNDYSLQLLLYRAVIELVGKQEYTKAYVLLNKWLNVVPHKKKILVLFDPRIKDLQSGPRWDLIKSKVKRAYKAAYKNAEQSFLLDSLWAEDQRYRTLKYYIQNLSLYVPSIDDGNAEWKVNFTSPPEEQLHLRDSLHYQALLEVIGTERWPADSECGNRPAKGAFLIVNHRLDTLSLSHFLPLIKERCLEGESKWIYYVTMYDRLQTLKGKPQKYGTQYRRIGNTDKYELFELEDATKVNEWRQELGLVLLSGFE